VCVLSSNCCDMVVLHYSGSVDPDRQGLGDTAWQVPLVPGVT